MDSNEVEQFLIGEGIVDARQVKIILKKRATIWHFEKTGDYTDLKRKNFWRVVRAEHLEDWVRSKNIDVARLFNGAEFSKLVVK